MKFGIDRDIASVRRAGNTGDLLARGVVTAAVLPTGAVKPVNQRAAFVNQMGSGFSPADGFGFIDGNAALKSIGK